MGTIYASATDLGNFGVPTIAFGQLTVAQQNAALAGASATMDSYFRARYALPFVSFGVEVVECCCVLAAYRAMHMRGFNPAGGADTNFVKRYELAMQWLKDVKEQLVHPDVVANSSLPMAQPVVASGTTEGGASPPTFLPNGQVQFPTAQGGIFRPGNRGI